MGEVLAVMSVNTLAATAPRSEAGKKLRGRELRAHLRVSVDIAATVECHDRLQPVRIKNVSQGGMLIEGAYNLFTDDEVVIRTLRGRAFAGRVAWALNSHCGIQFFEQLDRMDPILKPSAKGER